MNIFERIEAANMLIEGKGEGLKVIVGKTGLRLTPLLMNALNIMEDDDENNRIVIGFLDSRILLGKSNIKGSTKVTNSRSSLSPAKREQFMPNGTYLATPVEMGGENLFTLALEAE